MVTRSSSTCRGGASGERSELGPLVRAGRRRGTDDRSTQRRVGRLLAGWPVARVRLAHGRGFPLVLRKDDYSLLVSYLNNARRQSTFDRRNAEELSAELKKATVVNKNDFPQDVVRLNSKVRIKAEGKSEEMELILVTPDKANIKEKRISIMAPIGTALIGFRQGQKVKWKVPAGNKTFMILEVSNDYERSTA